METIIINTENSKTNEAHKFRLSLSDKLNLKNPPKNIALGNLSIYYTWKNIGMILLIYLMVFILLQILKIILNLSLKNMKLYPNKVKNMIVFKIKTGYKLELLSPETMKLLGSTKKVVDKKKKNGEDVPKLESVEVVLIHCNLVNNNYQQTSTLLFTFVPNKQLGQLINIVAHSLTMLSTANTEFSFTEVWFTDQNSKPFEIEDNDNLTVIIGLILLK